MSDAELSDDGIVREHENQNSDNDGGSDQEVRNVSGDEVMNNENNDEEGKRVEPPKKKITRKMVVLNTERLKGSKGVHTIEKLYQGFKFHGKGHEKEDLDRVMKKLEYWAFRLFPKLEFDDFLAKCEHLGHKKDLQVHLKKYRTDIINADSYANDFIEENDSEDEVLMQAGSNLADNNLDDIGVENHIQNTEAQVNNDFQRLFDENHENNRPDHTSTRSTNVLEASQINTNQIQPVNNVQNQIIDDDEFERLADAVGPVDKRNKETQNNDIQPLPQSKPTQNSIDQVEMMDEGDFESLTNDVNKITVQTQKINQSTQQNINATQVIDDDDFDALMADFA